MNVAAGWARLEAAMGGKGSRSALTLRSPSAYSSMQRARRAATALADHRYQFAALVDRQLVLYMPSKMKHTQPISIIQWTSSADQERDTGKSTSRAVLAR